MGQGLVFSFLFSEPIGNLRSHGSGVVLKNSAHYNIDSEFAACPTIMAKIIGTLGKIPEILKPQEIFFLQLRRCKRRSFNIVFRLGPLYLSH